MAKTFCASFVEHANKNKETTGREKIAGTKKLLNYYKSLLHLPGNPLTCLLLEVSMQEEEKSDTHLETFSEHLLTEGTLSHSKRIKDPEKYKILKFKI